MKGDEMTPDTRSAPLERYLVKRRADCEIATGAGTVVGDSVVGKLVM